MRYNVIINQERCRKNGLTVSEGALMDLLNQLSSWANDEVIDGKTFYHISRNKVIDELPFFYEKPDTVYRAFKSLSEKNLIEFKKKKRKDFVRLSPKGKGWNKFGNKSEFNSNSEINPSKVGNFSESEKSPLTPIKPVKIIPNPEINPTDNIYNLTKDNSLREVLLKIRTDYPLIYESILEGKTFHERLQISLRSEKLPNDLEKDIYPVLCYWLKNKWTANDLDKPVSRLSSEASSYTLKVIKNGGLKTNEKEPAPSGPPKNFIPQEKLLKRA